MAANESFLPSDRIQGRETGTSTVPREEWTKKREYMLSLIGFAVGLGSLLRFPYLCNRNGGGAFLIPYFFGIFTCAVPLFFLEVTVGQFSSRSATHVWVLCPLLKGIGFSQLLASFIGAVLYNVIIAWCLYYVYLTCRPVLPWTTCDNWWNTPIYNTLRVSSGIDNFGAVQGHLVICIFASWVVVFLCVMKGVRSVGKVVYVSAVVPYVLLTVLLIRMCMMPGAGEGILYFLRPDFSRLASIQVWLEALLQGFYSMSTTYGSLITMSSYVNFHNTHLRDVVLVTVASETTNIFCGLVVFSTLGFMAHRAHIPLPDVVSSGQGLGFIIYPEAISQLPVPHLWAILFFLMMFSMGIDSMFGSMETVTAGIIEMCPKSLQCRRLYVTAGVCLVSFVLSIPYTNEGGIYLFQLLDWYSSSSNVLLIGCLECVAINWIYGSKRLSSDIEMMSGQRFPVLLKVMSSYITPFILFVSLISSLFLYDPPSYGEYTYPEYAKVIGILMAVVMSLPIPIVMVYEILKRKGGMCKRLRLASQPAPEWGPLRPEHRELYLEKMDNLPGSLFMRTLSRTVQSK